MHKNTSKKIKIYQNIYDTIAHIEKENLHITNKELPRILLKYYKDPFSLYSLCFNLFGKCELYEEYIAESPGATYHYWLNVIRDKLPENMHRKMLMKYLEDPKDDYLISYFKGCKNKHE